LGGETRPAADAPRTRSGGCSRLSLPKDACLSRVPVATGIKDQPLREFSFCPDTNPDQSGAWHLTFRSPDSPSCPGQAAHDTTPCRTVCESVRPLETDKNGRHLAQAFWDSPPCKRLTSVCHMPDTWRTLMDHLRCMILFWAVHLHSCQIDTSPGPSARIGHLEKVSSTICGYHGDCWSKHFLENPLTFRQPSPDIHVNRPLYVVHRHAHFTHCICSPPAVHTDGASWPSPSFLNAPFFPCLINMHALSISMRHTECMYNNM
jgi:hypothetical protein